MPTTPAGPSQPPADHSPWYIRLRGFPAIAGGWLRHSAGDVEKHRIPWLKYVKLLKLFLQAGIALAIVWMLGAKAWYRCRDLLELGPGSFPHMSHVLRHMPTLTLVGRSLAYSAGLELAYMLLTPGPDEAIDPIIIGLAASILVIISDENFDSADKVIVPIACLAIGFLLCLKRYFHDELNGHVRGTTKAEDPSSTASSGLPGQTSPA